MLLQLCCVNILLSFELFGQEGGEAEEEEGIKMSHCKGDMVHILLTGEAIKMAMTTAKREAMDSRVRNDPKGHDTPSISNWA